jgi:carbonic anhydrase
MYTPGASGSDDRRAWRRSLRLLLEDPDLLLIVATAQSRTRPPRLASLSPMAQEHPILDANRRFADGFDQGALPVRPARQLVIVSCMDSRIDTFRALGLELGDAHVIRNAGGRASDDVIRSLIISTTLLGTREVLVVHHTDCGLMGRSEEELRALVAGERGSDTSDLEFLSFADHQTALRADVEKIRASPHLAPDLLVSGYLYDVHSGRLSERVPAGSSS